MVIPENAAGMWDKEPSPFSVPLDVLGRRMRAKPTSEDKLGSLPPHHGFSRWRRTAREQYVGFLAEQPEGQLLLEEKRVLPVKCHCPVKSAAE